MNVKGGERMSAMVFISVVIMAVLVGYFLYVEQEKG